MLSHANDLTILTTTTGHGGRQTVDFLEDALEKNIAIELKETDDATVLDRLARYVLTDLRR